MSPTVAVRTVLQKYAVFSGRARRSEYWYFALFQFVLVIALEAVGAAFHRSVLIDLLFLVIFLALIVPGLAVTVRRLHDTDKSGWFILLGLIPFAGGIIMIVFCALDGTPGDNSYGPSPKLGIGMGGDGRYGNAPSYGQPYGGQAPLGGRQPYGNEPPSPPVS